MARLLISGYYGFNNTGDEALLDAIVSTFREMRPDVELTVLSEAPAETEERLEVEAVNRLNPFAVFRSVADADLVVSGGGTLLQDVTSLRSLIYYAGVIFLADWMSKPVMIYANGLGPLDTAAGRWLTGRILRRVRRITWRDQRTAAEANALFPDAAEILAQAEVTADPVFTLRPAPKEKIKPLLRISGLSPEQPMVGLSLRDWQENGFLPAVTAVCRDLQQKGYRIVFLPMQPSLDARISHEIAAKLDHGSHSPFVFTQRLSPKMILGLMGEFEFVIGMRLHSLIMAAA